jgi:hypothetical protein
VVEVPISGFLKEAVAGYEGKNPAEGAALRSAPWSTLPATEPTGKVALGLPVVGPPSFHITSLSHRS